MKTIALPVFENRISNRIDCCDDILLISVENGTVRKRQIFHWALAKPLEKIDSLTRLGVDVLICDGITEFYTKHLADTPIQVFSWVSGTVEEVLKDFLNGKFKVIKTREN